MAASFFIYYTVYTLAYQNATSVAVQKQDAIRSMHEASMGVNSTGVNSTGVRNSINDDSVYYSATQAIVMLVWACVCLALDVFLIWFGWTRYQRVKNSPDSACTTTTTIYNEEHRNEKQV